MHCVICGDHMVRHTIEHGGVNDENPPDWQSEFRFTEVLPPTPDGDEARLSGIGINITEHGWDCRAPLSYDARWDDEGYHFSDIENVPSVRRDLRDPHFGDTQECYILHAQCYTLLERCFHPRPVPVTRLIELCRSCPEQHSILNMGHDYGQRVELEKANPWEELDISNRGRKSRMGEGDPCKIPELIESFQKAQVYKPRKESFDPKEMHEAVANCLTKLPHEILGYILTFLPTDEVKILSQTCKGLKRFIPSQLAPSFWASRFEDPFEFNFIFEAQTYKDKLDWRSLYFEVSKMMQWSPGLKIVYLHWNTGHTLQPVDRSKHKLRWKEVHGDIKRWERTATPDNFTGRPIRGCKRFHTQRTSIPSHVRRVIVSTIVLDTGSYVTGLCFISHDGLEISLGYTLKEGETPPSNIKTHVTNTAGIQGFIVALGSKGIQALRLIFEDEQLSPWFGCPDGLLKTRRLANFKSIVAVEAGFDGFKMVSLAIAEKRTGGPRKNAESLRDNALWFPDIPESHLQLNDAYFTGMRDPTSGFEPLCYALFRDVINPRPPTKVSMLWETNYIATISFHYATGDVVTLGHEVTKRRNEQESISLDIDGPAGEAIKFMKIGRAEHDDALYGKRGRLMSLQVFTNRRRRKLFRDCCTDERGQPGTVVVTPGTTVTGIYGQWQDEIVKIIGLGVISEFIK